MKSTIIASTIKNITIGAAAGVMLAACGGGASDTSTSGQSKLLVDANSVKISIPAANVTASSTDTTNVPANAVDGNLSTHWTGGAASGNQWIQFKLPSCYTADYAKVSWYNGDARQYTYTIDASADNGATWATVKTVTTDGLSAALVQVDFPNTAANMMRISSSGSNVSTKVSLNDVEFWGLSGATCGSGSGLDPSKSPGGNFNLSNYTLQLPTGSSGNVDTVDGATLEGGYTKSPYFYTDSTDGSMTMMDPQTGWTTSGSLHSRTEMRENGDWSATGTTNTLNATVKVTKIPSSATAIAQVFQGSGAPSKPLCELQYGSNGVLQVLVEDSNQGGVSHMLTGLPTIAIGTKFTYQLNVSGRVVTITINGTSASFTMDSSFADRYYFKAGNYWQGATSGTPQTTDGAVVKFYALSIAH